MIKPQQAVGKCTKLKKLRFTCKFMSKMLSMKLCIAFKRLESVHSLIQNDMSLPKDFLFLTF